MDTKECNNCEEEKTLDCFNKNSSGRLGLHNSCKSCRSSERKKLDFKRTNKETKLCLSCNIELPTTNYNSAKSSSDGLQTYCKECHTVKTYTNLSRFKPFMKNLFGEIKYNAKTRDIKVEITLEDLFELYEKQDGKCMYSGVRMTHNKMPSGKVKDYRSETTNPYNISVDRIDSTKDYTKENIQMVAVSVNHMKWNLTEENFLEMCELIVNFSKIKST